MTTLIFVRHGETLWNRESRFQGHLDIELNETGRFQAKQAATRLATEKIDAIYSSDLKRAAETAQIIAEVKQLSVTTTQGLRERNGGIWQGLTTTEIFEQYPETAKKWRMGDTSTAPSGGETINQLCDRSTACLMGIVEKHPDRTLLIVSHGGTLKAIICDLLGMPRSNFSRLRLDNVSISMAAITKERRVLSLMNDTSHTRIAEDTEADSA